MASKKHSIQPDVFKVHILDVGSEKYGDSTYLDFGSVTILIDGAHSSNFRPTADFPSIPAQMETVAGTPPPHDLTLLVVTHAHLDHIGCLPALVRDELIRPKWALVADPFLGWGLTEADAAALVDAPTPPLAAALREEPRLDGDDYSISEFIADAGRLRDRYIEMIQTLVDRGTNVVRFGVDPVEPLVEAIRAGGVQMDILGPTEEHLFAAAEAISLIGRDTLDAVEAWRRAVPTIDSATADVQLYRQILGSTDAIDVRSAGAAVNNQSIVLRFKVSGRSLLFPGDMQFAKPEVAGLELPMRALRQSVVDGGPYDFFRLPHHGSYNAFDTAMCDELPNTTLYAISTGADSKGHPNPRVLQLLDSRRTSLNWVRTDRNGLITIEFGRRGKPEVRIARGQMDDAKPNAVDQSPRASSSRSGIISGATRATPVPPTPTTLLKGPGADMVEVRARVPHTSTRVTITIDVEPRQQTGLPGRSSPPTVRAADRPGDGLELGGGRELPRLLFVTDREVLAANVGSAEADAALGMIRRGGQPLVEHLNDGLDAARTSEAIRAVLAEDGNVRGVVLVGGYDVVPSQRLDVLDPALREHVGSAADPDDFIVWSDDVYGCTDGDGLPELPVSRIPDGKSAELLLTALSAGNVQAAGTRRGVRNVQRPFADRIFSIVPGTGSILSSQPHVHSAKPAVDLACDNLYLMLHGDDQDATRFWGEDTPGNEEAINLAALPSAFGGTAFAGCCWGGLPAVTTAVNAVPGARAGGRTPDESIPLALLKAGALAFVGCTGAHYSPSTPPYKYFGGPMHEAFWRRMANGESPAEALFGAKSDYIAGMPHDQHGAVGRAIENKILWQYTCLGLGW